ncbi:amino acid adenylation domain-containing protein [Nonomuraea sp. NPDC050663]|uniref:amino acid adenylation domain-containing protein n=1 Tax=Nonomuraea sp. NPDC050663 TaxID=3364370 RepID=UPI0037BAE3BC
MKAPLAPQQERLWLLHRLDPGDASYNMYRSSRLLGPLDRPALERAVAALVRRHEGLRTRFREEDGVPWAILEPSWTPAVEWAAFTSIDEADRYLTDRINDPFDLTQPPFRVLVVRLAPDDHLLCLMPHHIVADGWAAGVMHDDLAELYNAEVTGREPGLRPLPVGPADYARWQRRRAERAVPYWQDKLAEPPPPDLPFARVRTAEPGVRPARGGWWALPAGVMRELDRLARAHRASLFMVLMAAHQVLIARHTGHGEVLVGTVAAGRDRVEIEPMVGYVSQAVVMRGDLGDDPSFTELLERTRREALEVLGRPAVPFERIRQPAATLMPSMFILQDVEMSGRDAFHGLREVTHGGALRHAKLGLAAEVWRSGEDYGLTMTWDAGLFDQEDGEVLAARYVRLLESIAADPSVPVSRLELWPEQGAVSGEPGTPRDALPPVRGEDPAVICGDVVVSHAALRERAARLAGGLAANGIRPGDIVGVRLPRSPEAIIALLAIRGAGAAYLPLDPADPAEHAVRLLEEAGAAAVISWDGLPYKVLDPELTGEPLEREPAGAAYVIFTSGSTGMPKGVLVGHEAVAARVDWMVRDYGLGPGDRVVQFASLSFDAHVEEIFPALAAGAALVLLPEGAASLPDVLGTSTGRQVTVLDLPTAYWHRLVDDLDEIVWPPGLRLVIIGGDQAHETAVARWHERFGERVRLVNTYGPTEATVIATAADLAPEDGRPPIGRPIGATTVAVLDRHGRPLPAGCAGELAIGGAGVATGYLGRPGPTAAAFVPDPDGPPGSRRYLTGDRARWRSDGRLEFLGRADSQVKVRGFRIETGEVEQALLALPGVAQVYVTARGDDLVCYLAGSATDDELRTGLAARLPRQFVPTLWVRLDAMPLTRTGKIDKAALPEPRPAVAEHVPPEGEAEELVAGIWQDLLGVKAGRTSDFFELGGHSLLATRVVARLRAALGIQLSIMTIFDRSTVAALAAAVEEALIEELAL